MHYSSGHISALIRNWKLGSQGYLTKFYGAPEVSNRSHSWELLRRLNSNTNYPWLVVGDFNEILVLEEIKERVARSPLQMQLFQSMVNDHYGLKSP